MKIYILTSVALFAEYGDLDSLESPSVQVSVHPSLRSAQTRMRSELEQEKFDAEAAGYDNNYYKAKADKTTARFERGSIGEGVSYNLVEWEIVEKETPQNLQSRGRRQGHRQDSNRRG